MKKYEFTEETLDWEGRTLHRIRALKDFGDVKAGDIGGWIEEEKNLSHEGDCWIYSEAKIYGNAAIKNNAVIRGNAVVGGHAVIGDDAIIRGYAVIEDNAVIGGYAAIGDHAVIEDHAVIGDDAVINGNTIIKDNAVINGRAVINSDRDYMTINPIDSRNGATTAFRTLEGTKVQCGCFYGSISEFEEKVKETHGNNQYAKEYLAFIELLKVRFKDYEN